MGCDIPNMCAGVSEEASSMLIPISVLVYCVAGGIKVCAVAVG